jgi:hypothetical protein
MPNKSEIHRQFNDTLHRKRKTLNALETSAVTMFFGVENSEDLITQKSVELYNVGETIVNNLLDKT